MTLNELRAFLLAHLTDDVMPFWMTHSIDRERGGLFSYLDNDGTVLSRNKSMISNTRGLWTFAALVNRIDDNPEWRAVAEGIYSFLKRHGRDENGLWVYITDEKGETVQGESSIVTDAFAIYGLVEYFRMTGDDEALAIAKDTARLCMKRLAHPGTYKTDPYPTPPGLRAQRESMQFSLMLSELGAASGDAEFLEEGLRYGRDVLDVYWRPERGVLLEYIGEDNLPKDTPAGRTMVPGHAIESLWFQIHVFGRLAGDSERAAQASEALKSCFERGWDPEFGGILLGIDVDGREPVYWKFAEMKRWWPHTEAMPAALLAYEQLDETWCLDWYWEIHDWSFAHFPNREYGDWNQNLLRDGTPIPPRKPDAVDAEALGETDESARRWLALDMCLKDPFHLHRGLIVSIETLDRLTADA